MFWSPTCTHCQVEVPQLVKWVAANPGVVDIVGVTIMKRDKPGRLPFRTITQNYVREKGIPWTIVEDGDGAVADLYENISTPTTFFVAPSGRVTGIWYYPHADGIEKPMTEELARLRAAPADSRKLDPPAGQTLVMSILGADGKRVELASLLDKPAIVHFWATWCKPCVEELPSLLRAREALEKATGGRLVLVSVEDESSGKRISEFAKSLGTPFSSYRAPSGGAFDKVDPSYRVPRTYLVASGGRVVAGLSGSQDWADREMVERVRSRLVNAPPAATR
jgi:thiol-disulfide isomerase/thioredoxin